MTVLEHLAALAAALPSDSSAVTFTRADLVALIEGEAEALTIVGRDLTISEVAEEMQRATSTVRGWLISGTLRGYKLNHRDWRIPRSALRAYIEGQSAEKRALVSEPGEEIDLGAWRKVRRNEDIR